MQKPTLTIAIPGPGAGRLRVPLGDGWFAEYSWRLQGAQLTLTGLRVTSEPEGQGLTSDVLRRLTLGRHDAILRGLLARQLRTGAGLSPAARQALGLELPAPPTRSGPGAWPAIRYAKLAQSYVEAVEAGSREPVATTARKHRLSTTQVRDALNRARKRGLLTAQKQGSAGGRLTPAARKILKGDR
jgi:hypothetical protein